MTPQLSFPIPCQRSQLYHQMMNWKVSQLRPFAAKNPQAPAFFRLFRAEGVHRSLRTHPITGNHIFHLTNLNLRPSACLSGLKNNRLLWRMSILGKISSMWFPSSKCQPECNSVITQSITNPCIVITIQDFNHIVSWCSLPFTFPSDVSSGISVDAAGTGSSCNMPAQSLPIFTHHICSNASTREDHQLFAGARVASSCSVTRMTLFMKMDA